jgi:hypothetical protein
MQVILLNQDYSYINSISVRRALRLIAKEKVTVEKYSERIVRTVTEDIAVPLILRLVWRRRLWSKHFDHPDPVHNRPSKEELAL